MKTHPSCWFLPGRAGFKPRTSTNRPLWSRLHHHHHALTHKPQTADLPPLQRMMEIFDVVPSDRDQCLARRCSVPGNEISGKTQFEWIHSVEADDLDGPQRKRHAECPFFVVRFPLASFAVRVDEEDLEAGNERPRCSEKGPIGPGRLTRGRVCMNDVARRPRKVLWVCRPSPPGRRRAFSTFPALGCWVVSQVKPSRTHGDMERKRGSGF